MTRDTLQVLALRKTVSDLKDQNALLNAERAKDKALLRQALEALEALKAENERLREALKDANDGVVFIDGVGAGRSNIKSCRDGVQWVRVGNRVYWPLSDSDAKRLHSACCGNGHFDGPATPTSEGESND